MRLTDIAVKNLPPPPSGQRDYRDESLPGFLCRVSQGGTKTFVLIHGADRRRTTLGRYPVISLQDARTTAKHILAERTLSKHRPVRIRASDALSRFFTEKEAKNRASTIKIDKAVINNHFSKLLPKYLEDIRTDDITDVTDKLLKQGQPGAAAHAFTAIRTFLKWCVKRRYLQHSPIEGLDKPGQSISRERVLSDDELRTVWRAADELGGHFGDIVKLLILTGQRRSEIGSLTAEYCELKGWDGIIPNENLGGSALASPFQATICLPSTLTKNRRTHTFPISALAADILRSNITTGTTILFPARGSTTTPFNGWSKAKVQLDAKAKIVPWTLHDLRRTYATNLQRLGIKLEVIEALLNHISGTRAGIVGVYQRHAYEAEMRAAVDAFDTWFQEVILEREEL